MCAYIHIHKHKRTCTRINEYTHIDTTHCINKCPYTLPLHHRPSPTYAYVTSSDTYVTSSYAYLPFRAATFQPSLGLTYVTSSYTYVTSSYRAATFQPSLGIRRLNLGGTSHFHSVHGRGPDHVAAVVCRRSGVQRPLV